MDYIDRVEMVRHRSWEEFTRTAPRLILMTTHGENSLYDHQFTAGDTLLFGQESAGVPPHVASACAARLRIPISADSRSLNLSVACGIAVAEALRGSGGLPC